MPATLSANAAVAATTAGAAPDAWGPYRVGHASERLSLLKHLRDAAVPVLLSSSEGGTVTTALWALDEASGTVNFSGDLSSPHMASLVDGGEVVAVAYLESVKLQFDLLDLLLVHGARTSTLQAKLPQEIYRFQRRDAFRVRPVGRQAPVARFAHPTLRDMPLQLRVLDVSIGGCALWLPHDVPALQPGSRLAEVLVQLDADTQLPVELTLHHVSSLGTGGDGNHASGVRLGCSWRPLNPGGERSLQRWIDESQKRRRTLAAP